MISHPQNLCKSLWQFHDAILQWLNLVYYSNEKSQMNLMLYFYSHFFHWFWLMILDRRFKVATVPKYYIILACKKKHKRKRSSQWPLASKCCRQETIILNGLSQRFCEISNYPSSPSSKWHSLICFLAFECQICAKCK